MFGFEIDLSLCQTTSVTEVLCKAAKLSSDQNGRLNQEFAELNEFISKTGPVSLLALSPCANFVKKIRLSALSYLQESSKKTLPRQGPTKFALEATDKIEETAQYTLEYLSLCESRGHMLCICEALHHLKSLESLSVVCYESQFGVVLKTLEEHGILQNSALCTPSCQNHNPPVSNVEIKLVDDIYAGRTQPRASTLALESIPCDNIDEAKVSRISG